MKRRISTYIFSSSVTKDNALARHTGDNVCRRKPVAELVDGYLLSSTNSIQSPTSSFWYRTNGARTEKRFDINRGNNIHNHIKQECNHLAVATNPELKILRSNMHTVIKNFHFKNRVYFWLVSVESAKKATLSISIYAYQKIKIRILI